MSTTILSIESSCDETAAAVVVDGREVKSNIIYSQIELHKLYGGVVPEIASRKHVEKVNQVIRAAIEEAHVTWDDIDAVAVTYGPGLVGALLVGVSAAKAVAYAKKKPLVGNFLETLNINNTYEKIFETRKRFKAQALFACTLLVVCRRFRHGTGTDCEREKSFFEARFRDKKCIGGKSGCGNDCSGYLYCFG